MALKNLDPLPRAAQALRVPILLIDNSNTRTKFALAETGTDGGLLDWHAVIPTAEISEETLSQTLANISWHGSVVSSVVPKKSATLTRFLSEKPHHTLSYQSKLPIGIDYPQPAQIGADRLANAAAAHQLYGSPTIVLDFGTAVTFDVISPAVDSENKQAVYRGGVIAPGLASMTEGLARRTALLPHIQLEEPQHAIGRSTEEAMLAGAVYGYRGLIKEILHHLRAEIPGTPTVVATGGDAPLITKALPEINHLAPQLTLEGLRIVGQLNL